MPGDQSHPFATFPAHPGKSLHGLRPYYTPGLTTENYTSVVGNAPSISSASVNGVLQDDLIDSRAAARELINYTVLKYITSAIASPFEVSRTLAQVQYRPTNERRLASTAAWEGDGLGEDQPPPPEAEDDSDLSDPDDIYGSESHHKRRRRSMSEDLRMAPTLDVSDPAFKRHVPTDARGYVVPSGDDESRRPPHQIKPIDGGVWQGIGRLLKQPHEGWRSLFKGQYTNWLYDVLHLFLQPTLEGSLNDMFGLYDDTVALVHLDHVGPNLATIVGSHVMVGFLLSPLELIRTRLMVQSSAPLQRKYKGPFHALRTILSEEGGLQGLYLSHNLVPTLLEHTLIPLLQNTAPLIIDRVFGISAHDSPFLYSLAEFSLNMLEVVISLPLDTIRKRIQCQINTRTPQKRFETVVALRPVPYTGVLDAAYKIITEEGGRGKKKGESKRASEWGLQGLYRGFTMQFTTNLIMFILRSVDGIDDTFGPEYDET